jgi:hypothetical protein
VLAGLLVVEKEQGWSRSLLSPPVVLLFRPFMTGGVISRAPNSLNGLVFASHVHMILFRLRCLSRRRRRCLSITASGADRLELCPPLTLALGKMELPSETNVTTLEELKDMLTLVSTR